MGRYGQFNPIGALRGNRLMLRGIGMTEKELEILGISHAGRIVMYAILRWKKNIALTVGISYTKRPTQQKSKNYEGDCYAKRNKCNCYGLYLFKSENPC